MASIADLPIAAVVAIFAVSSVIVWFAGGRLTDYANAISGKTGLGQAVMGMLLLAGVTSLPEIAVTTTAAAYGVPQLALNNLFGSIALQVALLAIVDLFIGRDALTSVVPDPKVMLAGSLNVILIVFAAAGMIAGDIGVFGVGLWAWGCLFIYIGCVWLMADAQRRQPWLAAKGGKVDRNLRDDDAGESSHPDASLAALVWKTAAVAAVILASGYALARSGEAIAEATGLGQSFVGFVLVAFATSLPEFSAALAAARRRLYTMAITDILGTNLINIALIFVVDAIVSGDPVLNRLQDFAVFGALLSVILTGIFVAGLAERRDRSVLRMGYDSLLVIVTYLGGVAILYAMRPD